MRGRALPLFGFGVFCAIAVAAYAVSVGYRTKRMEYVASPPMSGIAQHPEWTEVPGLQEVSFHRAGGARVGGWYLPSRNRAAVILLMGTNADRAMMLPELRLLSAAGFGVLTYDSPGYGTSEGTIEWGHHEIEALRAGIDWVAARPDVDPRRIGALGFSAGGVILDREAATDPRLRGIVFLAAPIDTAAKWRWDRKQFAWGMLSGFGYWLAFTRYQGATSPGEPTPEQAIALLAPRPVLIIGGTEDGVVPPEAMQSAFARAREPKELWIVPGAEHGRYVDVAPAEYARRLTRFFSRALLD